MVTLTFDDDHLPYPPTLDVRDWQLFAKRVRKRLGPFRYYHCGEYGEKYGRPHYHGLLFGLDFPDKFRIQDSPSGARQWQSVLLDKCWQNQGRCTLGSVTFESAAYVAGYIQKKVTGARAKEHYTRVDPETGELFEIAPEYATMSRGKGIGASWLEKYGDEVYPSDEVIARGVPCKPPRYYDKKHAEADPEAFEALRRERRRNLDRGNSSERRLQVRELCAEARLNLYPRSVE